jgi:Bacterial Ig-like domain (group 2)/Divergent InlB B-repeat domain
MKPWPGHAPLAALLLLAGCGTTSQPGGTGGTLTPVSSVTLVPATATLRVGDALALTASIKAADGAALSGVAVTWSSSNSTLAAVDQTGRVTALAVGDVDVTATAAGLPASAHLKIVAAATPLETLSVSITGSGAVSGPNGFACASGICTADFPKGAAVALVAAAAAGSVFSGWGGACSGTSPCTLTLESATSVAAAFTVEPLLTVAVHGQGTVTSDPAGISCTEGGAHCSAPFPAGTQLTLTEQPGAALQFGGWGGACAGSGSQCLLKLDASASATAQFGTFYTLSFATTGNGTVSANGGALQACGPLGGACSGLYAAGTQVVLTAAPGAGAALSAWSGACAAASGAQCTLTIDSALSAGASFAASTTLTAASGDGQSAPIDAPLPSPIVLHLTSGGSSLVGAAVSLTGPEGASVTPPGTSTDSQGNATFFVRLARTVGTQTFTARTQAATLLTLSATATAPAPGTLFTLVNASHNQGFDGFPGAATAAHLKTPSGLALAADGTLYIADFDGNALFALSPAGALSRIAGTGACGYSGDGGPALAAQLCQVLDLALDEAHGRRTLYLADSASSVVRAIDLTLSTPQITTFAGGGAPPGPGFGDGGPASQASLSVPARLSVGPDGYLYIADTGRNRIRRVGLDTQRIEGWLSGDSAFCRFGACAVSWDAAGRAFVTRNLYGYDFDLLRVGPDLALTAIAGGSNNTATADGIYPTEAKLFAPAPARFDGAGNLLLTEQGLFSHGCDVRRIDLATGKWGTTAGNGTAGYLGDYVPGPQGELNTPWTSVLDSSGNLYIADSGNAAVRMVWGAGQAAAARSSIAKTGGDQQQVGVDQITPAMQVTLTGPDGHPLAGYPVQWQSLDPGGLVFAGTVATDTSGLAAADGRVGLNQGGAFRYTASAFDFHGDALAGSPITFQDTSAELPAGYFFTVLNTSRTAGYTGVPGPPPRRRSPRPWRLRTRPTARSSSPARATSAPPSSRSVRPACSRRWWAPAPTADTAATPAPRSRRSSAA